MPTTKKLSMTENRLLTACDDLYKNRKEEDSEAYKKALNNVKTKYRDVTNPDGEVGKIAQEMLNGRFDTYEDFKGIPRSRSGSSATM